MISIIRRRDSRTTKHRETRQGWQYTVLLQTSFWSETCLPSPLPARVNTFLSPLSYQQCVYYLSSTCATTYLKYVLYKHLLVEPWFPVNLDFLYQMASTWKCKPAKRQKSISSFLSLEKKLKAFLNSFLGRGHYVPCGFWLPHFVVVYSAYEAAESSERVCDSQYSTAKLNLGARDTRHTIVNFLNTQTETELLSTYAPKLW